MLHFMSNFLRKWGCFNESDAFQFLMLFLEESCSFLQLKVLCIIMIQNLCCKFVQQSEIRLLDTLNSVFNFSSFPSPNTKKIVFLDSISMIKIIKTQCHHHKTIKKRKLKDRRINFPSFAFCTQLSSILSSQKKNDRKKNYVTLLVNKLTISFLNLDKFNVEKLIKKL